MLGSTIISWIVTIVTSTEIDCQDAYACNGQSLTCKPGEPCNIYCGPDYGCHYAAISCPLNQPCNVHCCHSYGCHYSVIECSQSSECNVYCYGVYGCWYTEIHGTTSIQEANNGPLCYNILSTPAPVPTKRPTLSPSFRPSKDPTPSPTNFPSPAPTKYPSPKPTLFPSNIPTLSPSNDPSNYPSALPSVSPSIFPSAQPEDEQTTKVPSSAPTEIQSEFDTWISTTTYQPYIASETGVSELISSNYPSQTPQTSTTPTSRPTEYPSTTAYIVGFEAIAPQTTQTSSKIEPFPIIRNTDTIDNSESEFISVYLLRIIILGVCICAVCLIFCVIVKQRRKRKEQQKTIHTTNATERKTIPMGQLNKTGTLSPRVGDGQSRDEVKQFLVSIDPKIASDCYDTFIINGWDTMTKIGVMDDQDLKDMNILPGNRKLIMHHISNLSEQVASLKVHNFTSRQQIAMKYNLPIQNLTLINSNSSTVPPGKSRDMSVVPPSPNISENQDYIRKMIDGIDVFLEDEHKKEGHGYPRQKTSGYVDEDEAYNSPIDESYVNDHVITTFGRTDSRNNYTETGSNDNNSNRLECEMNRECNIEQGEKIVALPMYKTKNPDDTKGFFGSV